MKNMNYINSITEKYPSTLRNEKKNHANNILYIIIYIYILYYNI